MFKYKLTENNEEQVTEQFIVKVSGMYDDTDPAVRETVFSKEEFTPEVMELVYMINSINGEMLNEISRTNRTLNSMLPYHHYNDIEEYDLESVTYVDAFGNHHDVEIVLDFTGEEWKF